MSDTRSDWQNNGFLEEDDEFDKTVSAFSALPPKKRVAEPETAPIDMQEENILNPTAFEEEEDEFDKTVSAFSGKPIPKKKEAPVAEEVIAPIYEDDEDDEFNKTVSAFSEKPRVPVQKTVQSVETPKASKKKTEGSFWSTGGGKFVKIVFILLPLLVLGVFTGPGALVVWPLAIWLVFWKLK